MEGEPHVSRLKMEIELDKISNLPSELLRKILALLPIREAGRTSVLSSKWRYKWAMLPRLVFNEESISRTGNHNGFVKIVDRVLLLHVGPIHHFELVHPDLLGTGEVDSWILHLSRNSIKHFHFCLWSRGQRKYKLPSSLFSCQDMITMSLDNCLLKVPSFMGFKSLKDLRLRHVTLSQDDFEKLIVCCPLLETLCIVRCPDLTHLKVEPPNLQNFWFKGVFESINFENTLQLRVVEITLEKNLNQQQVHGTSSNLLKFFVHLPHIQILRMSCYFLKYLAVGTCPPKLPRPCLELNTLDLCMSRNDQDAIITALCILRSSPSLNKLNIMVCQEEPNVAGDVNCWLDDGQNCRFTQLRSVKITGISGIIVEIDLIRLLLSASPMLEKMIINPASSHSSVEDTSKLLQKLIQLKRASTEAVIIYSDK